MSPSPDVPTQVSSIDASPIDRPADRIPVDQIIRIEMARLDLEEGHEITIHADDLHPGDVIDYCGHLHRVTRVDRGDGWSWPVAADDDGWAMALGHELIVLHRHLR